MTARVSIAETAKNLVALTRRTAMELVGLSRGDPDPTLVRHIYDRNIMREHIDPATVATIVRDIPAMDAETFGNQNPAFWDDRAGEPRKALAALQTDPVYRRRCDDFVSAMVYGERSELNERSRRPPVLLKKPGDHGEGEMALTGSVKQLMRKRVVGDSTSAAGLPREVIDTVVSGDAGAGE